MPILKRRPMKIIVLLLTVTFFCACHKDVKQTVLSPKEKIEVLSYTDYINSLTEYDTISELNSFVEINDLWLVGAQNGIYILDRSQKTVIKYFKFELKASKELQNDHDNNLAFLTTNFVTNKTKDKVLVITSAGIVFQINLKKYDVDWLVKFVNGIETAT